MPEISTKQLTSDHKIHPLSWAYAGCGLIITAALIFCGNSVVKLRHAILTQEQLITEFSQNNSIQTVMENSDFGELINNNYNSRTFLEAYSLTQKAQYTRASALLKKRPATLDETTMAIYQTYSLALEKLTEVHSKSLDAERELGGLLQKVKQTSSLQDSLEHGPKGKTNDTIEVNLKKRLVEIEEKITSLRRTQKKLAEEQETLKQEALELGEKAVSASIKISASPSELQIYQWAQDALAGYIDLPPLR
ncbi:MAG: hypothetical protein PHC51_06640 [bacterium]|nr:hypothetical protein [bacterium]